METARSISFWIVPFALALSACQGQSPETSGQQEPPAQETSSQETSSGKSSEGEEASDGSQVAARVGDETIRVAEIDQKIGSQLRQLEMQRYQARKDQLDEIIEQALLEREAKEQGVPPEELLQKKVDDQVSPPTDEEVRQYYEQYKNRLRGDFEQLEPRIRQGLLNQAKNQRRNEYLSTLREDADVTVALEPPRVPIDTGSGVAKGDPDAPIQLVEFSDFECPFCARSQSTVDQVLERYGDKIHHVFMDFPLTSMHPQAMRASIAARCAGDQGKYWEYHGLLFEHQKEFSRENYEKWAEELGLDTEKFASCLEADTHQSQVTRSLREGRNAGVSGTPAFFINGVMISGAQPFPAFQDIIESELARKS